MDKQPIHRCVYCGITVKEGYKSHGTIPVACEECAEQEYQKFIRDPEWGNVGRGEI